MWLRLLAKYFFASRGYSLDGSIWWTADDDVDDRGCIFAKGKQLEVIEDRIVNAGPSWSPSPYASDGVKQAIVKLVESADNTGCDGPISRSSLLPTSRRCGLCPKDCKCGGE